jgi:hypothetical protein
MLVGSGGQFWREAVRQFDPVTRLIFPHGCYTFCIAMRFEWDSEKNRINKQKHDGLSFESAAHVFDDPHIIFRKDRVAAGEQRWHAIGMATGALPAGCPRLSHGE